MGTRRLYGGERVGRRGTGVGRKNELAGEGPVIGDTWMEWGQILHRKKRVHEGK